MFKRKLDISPLKHGLIPSPKDDRDLLLSSSIPPIVRYPEEYPRPFDLTIYNQGQSPSCVGWTGAVAKQFLELKERHYIEPDGEWLYAECKKIDGIPNFPGTYFRSVLKVLKNVGCKIQGQDNDPSIYKISEYRQLDDLSFEGIKKAIAVYGLVISGWRGSNDGWRSETIRPPYPSESIWGHATALTHYYKNYIGGQNSWGTVAHRQGLFKAPKDYLPYEGWVITVDTPNVAKEPIKTGWCAMNWLQNNITTANLNVREQPGTIYKVIATLPQGTQVKLYGSANKPANGFWWTQIIL